MAMKNRNAPLIVAAVLIAAVAIGTLLARRSTDAPAAPPVVQDALEQDASRPSTPSAGRATGAGVGNVADRRARLQEAMVRRQESREATIRKSAEQRKQAAEAFQREQVDPAWAPQKEGELNRIAAQPAFETAGVVPKDMRVDCRSSMCRLDGSFANNGQAEDWILIYMSSVGSALPNALVSRVHNPDGTTSVEIYGYAR